jgi:hypothetical protein
MCGYVWEPIGWILIYWRIYTFWTHLNTKSCYFMSRICTTLTPERKEGFHSHSVLKCLSIVDPCSVNRGPSNGPQTPYIISRFCLRWRSPLSDWPRAGRPRGWSSRFFTSPRRPHRLWGPPQPPIQWVPGALSPEVKRPGREADHLPPTSAEIKKMWIYTSIPPYTLMA